MEARSSEGAAARNEPMLMRDDVGAVAILTLNRARARNALSEAMLAALRQEIARLAGDRRVKAVVVAANGPAFCAGHDLREITDRRADGDGGRGYMQRLMASCSAMMLALQRLPQPVIAAVEGAATAAGCQLVATCDLAIASRVAGFCTPGVNIGLFCSSPMVALSRNVARKHAMEMLLTGDTLDAREAARIGLVNRVVEPGAAREAALALGNGIAAKSAAAVKLGKEAFYRQLEMGVAEAYDYVGEVMVENMLARDAAEGISAFLDKRTPTWQDR